MIIAPEYTDAASRLADEHEITARHFAKVADARLAAELGAEATERAQYVARLKAERDNLRRQLREAQDDRQASLDAEIVAAATAERLQAELVAIRQQRAQDAERIADLRHVPTAREIAAEVVRLLFERNGAAAEAVNLTERVGEEMERLQAELDEARARVQELEAIAA